MEKNGMRKRRVGNYLKEYPHVYEAFQKEIRRQNTNKKWGFIVFGIWIVYDLTCRLIGYEDFSSFLNLMDVMFVVMVIGAFFMVSRGTGLISLEELELMEKDLSGEKEWVQNWGYSTEESFSIGFCRIPRKGLNAVYMGKAYSGKGLIRYGLEFYYEDGARFSAVNVTAYSEEKNFVFEKDFIQMVRRYDDSVKINKYQVIQAHAPLFWPFQKFDGEVQSVRKETLEELNTLSNGNRLWKLRAKGRDKWNGNKEVEITICGTALTWMLYLVWFCLSGYFFFGARSESVVVVLLIPLVAGLFYYLFFVKSAGKMTDKALDIFYRDLYQFR